MNPRSSQGMLELLFHRFHAKETSLDLVLSFTISCELSHVFYCKPFLSLREHPPKINCTSNNERNNFGLNSISVITKQIWGLSFALDYSCMKNIT